jgi:hypothetical protein
VSLDETRAQWLMAGQPDNFVEFVSGKTLYKEEKFWKPDRSSNSCNLCLQVFQFMTRHHCRCGSCLLSEVFLG